MPVLKPTLVGGVIQLGVEIISDDTASPIGLDIYLLQI
jgi:hypothetical protein